MKIGLYLRTVSYLFVFFAIVIIVIIPTALVASLPKAWRHRVPCFFWLEHLIFWLLLKATWVPIKYVGLSNIPQKTPLIFAANHQSSLDIPLMGRLARGAPHVWLLWHALTKYPVFGYIMRRMNIIVDTRSPRRAVAAIHQASELLKGTKRHLMICPEGGRYVDGTIHPFFRGFAMVARETHRPVVPVMIINAGKVNPPKTVLIHYAPITVIIGEPFTYQEGETDREFLARVHAWFKQHEPTIR